MQLTVPWSDLKAFAVARNLSIQWFVANGVYYLTGIDGSVELLTQIPIVTPAPTWSDQADFELNFKATGNLPANAAFIPITGSASSADAPNNVVFSTLCAGYSTAYVLVNESDSGTPSNNVTANFECSPDGIQWFTVPQFAVTAPQTPNAVVTDMLLVSSGSYAGPQAFKVRMAGRFFRMIISYMDTPGTTVTATTYLTPSDNGDTFSLVQAQLVDFFGNSPVTGSGNDINGLCTVQASNQRYATSADTFTAASQTGNIQGSPVTNPDTGSTQTQFFFPMRHFSIQVVPTGAVTSWTVVLEGSLDGQNFDTILTHTNSAPGAGKLVVSGTSVAPVFYIRSNCKALVLGVGGTNVVSTILGLQ